MCWGRVAGGRDVPPAVIAVIDLAGVPDLARVWGRVRGIEGLHVSTGWRSLMTVPPTVVLEVEILTPACRFDLEFVLPDRLRTLRSLCDGQDLILMTVEGMAASENCDWEVARRASLGIPAPPDHVPVELAQAWMVSDQHRERARRTKSGPAQARGRVKRARRQSAEGRRRARRPS
jgi:hypothetical protein